ncbi:hypothetical protein [uncultured Abyssibacter sp.]|uniref:hypothetical protein n=1 Tax=uncultured Abyssibacter sp. TaxID=2320202 RepID=UPI0032B19514
MNPSVSPSSPGGVARVLLPTVALLLVPLLAMQVTDEVAWGLMDFVAAAGLLLGAGFTYQFVARRVSGPGARRVVGTVVLLALVTVWVNLAI